MSDIQKVDINGTEYTLSDTTARGDISTHVADTNNPHAVTYSQVGALPDSTHIPPDMVILAYGKSTWNDFITAYTGKNVVYCRASSNSNPGTGSQTRMAFLAYVNNETTPTEAEFQYYRSVATHSDSQQGDQVYVYKINSSGTWSVTVREAYTKVVAGSGLGSSYSSGTITLTSDVTSVAGKTGAVTLDSSDVGLGNVDNVQQYSASNPPPYPVTSVNTQTGDVTISIPSASTTNPSMDGTADYGSSTDYARADHVHPADTNKQDVLVSGTNIKTINSTSILGSGDISITSDVSSVNTKTGAVVLDGTDINVDDTEVTPVTIATALSAKYEKPSGGIPDTDLSSGVQASLGKADTALQSAPVTSVNGQTGAVTVDVGVTSFNGSTGAVTYTAPVTSVNGATGAVTVDVGVTSFNGSTGAVTYTAPVTSVNGATGAVTLSIPSGAAASKGVTDKTASANLGTSDTNLPTARAVTWNTVNWLNRTNQVNVANTSYTTYMARGIALVSSATNPAANGEITLQYG